MTVLNTANDGYYSNVVAICRAVAAQPRLPRERLQTICAAGAGSDQRTRQTLNRWIELGLLREDGASVVFADPDLVGRSPADVAGRLPAAMRRIVFAEGNNERFWESEASQCADLVRGLAWLLAQDVYTAGITSYAKAADLESRQVADASRRIVQNDVRWNGLRTWAIYLGFAWEGEALTIDPTAAVRDDLPRVFEGQNELAAEDFVRRLAEVLPVLDFGRYRREIERILDPIHWQRPPGLDVLSTSLSWALRRLQAENRLALEPRADAGSTYALQKQGGAERERFTHVRLII